MAWKHSNGNSRGKKRRDGRDGISSPVSLRQTAGFAGNSSLQAVLRYSPDETMDSFSFAVPGQHRSAGLDFLERGFSDADLAGIDLRTSRLVDGGVPGGRRG